MIRMRRQEAARGSYSHQQMHEAGTSRTCVAGAAGESRRGMLPPPSPAGSSVLIAEMLLVVTAPADKLIAAGAVVAGADAAVHTPGFGVQHLGQYAARVHSGSAIWCEPSGMGPEVSAGSLTPPPGQ